MRRTALVTLAVEFDDERINHPIRWDWTGLINSQGVSADVKSSKTLDVAAPTQLSLDNLSIEHLHQLTYGDPNLCDLCARSVHPSDSPVHRIRIVSHDLGRLISESDPNGERFHVELIPPTHAELWSAQAWKESLTRRLRHITATVDSDLPTLKQSVMSELSYLIRARSHCPRERAEHTADALIHYGDGNDIILDLLNIPGDLRARLFKLRSLLTA